MWTKENMPDQSGKVAIVTGGNSGIGYETALALYEKGATVILPARTQQKAAEAMAAMKKIPGKGSLEPAVLDLMDLRSVKAFAQQFLQIHTRLDLLINNAGIMVPPAAVSPEGYESQFATNVLGHFALTGYLYPLLKATGHARVVTVTSLAYLRGVIDFDNLRSEKNYDPMREYAQSKLGNVLFALELQRRSDALGDGVLSYAVQPGANATNLSRSMSKEAFDAAVQRVGPLMPQWQGALPSLYAATMPHLPVDAIYEPDQDGGYRGYPTGTAIAAHALDATTAQQLWTKAEAITGVRFPLAN